MMENLKINILCLVMTLGSLAIRAQAPDTATKAPGPMTLSLQQAQDYALQNSPVLKNSNLDLEMAKQKIWETTAIGLPQVNAKLSATYMIKLPESIEMFNGLGNLGPWMYNVDNYLHQTNTTNPAFGHVPPAKAAEPVSDFDRKWGANFDLTASQLLFSGGYLVGLQTSKVFRSLSEIAISKSKIDLAESVSNSYCLVLILQENKLIMDSLFLQTQKMVAEMDAIHKSGFIEETVVDQMRLNLNTIKNNSLAMSNQVAVSKNLLRLQMGMDMSQPFELTEKLDDIIAQNMQPQLLVGEFNASTNTSLQLVASTITLKKMNLKLQKSSFLPDVAAFYQFNKNFNKNSFSFTPPHIIGVGVSIPIFGSGMKIARVKQAKMDVIKSENDQYQATQAMKLAYSGAQASYSKSLDNLALNKENLELSRKIYERTATRVKNGMASSLELTQAQSQYLVAQTTYFTTVIELVNAKNTLEKLNK
jgi:outer membrane protein TolC